MEGALSDIGSTGFRLLLALNSLALWGLMLGLALPLKRGTVKRNQFYGFRTVAAMRSEEAFVAANRYYAERVYATWYVIPAVIVSAFLPWPGQPLTGPMVLLLGTLAGFLIPILQTLRWLKDRPAG